MTTFYIISEDSKTVKISISSNACYIPFELPSYCNPQNYHLWTKSIPGTTSFVIPADKKTDFEKIFTKT